MAASPLSEAEREAIAEVMRILGHGTRLRLVDALRIRGEQTVGALEALTGIGQPALSQQLAILRKAALVNTRRAARQVHYRLAPEALAAATALLASIAGTDTPVVQTRKVMPRRGSAAMFAKIL